MAYQRKDWAHAEPLTLDTMNNLEARIEGGVTGAVTDAQVYTDREVAKDRQRLGTLETRAAAEGKLIERIEDDNGDGLATVHYTNGLTDPLPLPAGPIGPAGEGAGLRRSSKLYKLPQNTVVRISDTDIPRQGTVWLMADGDIAPGPLWFNVYRGGTYSGVWKWGGSDRWRIGDSNGTVEPTGGDFRIWVDGTVGYPDLCVKSTNSWNRGVRFYWLAL